MGSKGDDWKQQALADFEQWLEEWNEDPLEADGEETAECDLRDLFAEMAAPESCNAVPERVYW